LGRTAVLQQQRVLADTRSAAINSTVTTSSACMAAISGGARPSGNCLFTTSVAPPWAMLHPPCHRRRPPLHQRQLHIRRLGRIVAVECLSVFYLLALITLINLSTNSQTL
jgi:hypothetical protein